MFFTYASSSSKKGVENHKNTQPTSKTAYTAKYLLTHLAQHVPQHINNFVRYYTTDRLQLEKLMKLQSSKKKNRKETGRERGDSLAFSLFPLPSSPLDRRHFTHRVLKYQLQVTIYGSNG